MTVAVFGDVHGRLDFLQTLVERIRSRYGDIPLYSTGDLIDRGPDSKGVIQFCIQEGVQAVLGNHDAWLHRYLTEGVFDEFALHPIMGGRATLESYGVRGDIQNALKTLLRDEITLKEHRRFILNMPVWRKFEVGGKVYRLSHAGLKTDAAKFIIRRDPSLKKAANADLLMEESALRAITSLLWIGYNTKNPNLHSFADGSIQVFGHVPRWKPEVTERWVAVDTGCGTRDPQRLSAVIFTDQGRTETLTVDAASGKVHGAGFSDFTL